ncbi:MAG TPA: serine protease, partial [Dehalococcoidia bacterium]|nr:serine protease [Dehalococcoidia bacterium]
SLAYQADVVAIDPSLDVAVLRIAANREGEEIAPEEAAIGAQLVLGSDEAPRNAVGLGYAARDSGQPAGVRLEFSAGLDGEGEWLEAPAVLPPGYAGAPVLDDAGAIVGLVAIPEPGDEAVFVRRISDARPMIEAALRGQELLLSGRVRLPPPERSESDFPRDLEIGGITFYTDLTPDSDPVGPTDHFPEGTRRIVYAFEYAAMRDGLPWLDEWRINGELDPQLSEPRPPWNRGPDGTLVSSINEPNGFSSGEYEVRVIVDSVLMASARVDVGDVPAVPNLKSLVLAPAKGDDGQPVGVGERLESASTLYGFFDYEGMDAVSNWGYVWYHGDDIVAERDGLPWRGGGAGSDWWVAYYEPDGSALQEGEYTLTLLLDGEPSATARVTIGAS